MICAGIDPSLSATAVCIGDGQSHEMRVFKSAPRGREVQERFARYEDLVSRIVDWLEPHCPAVICLEGYAHAAGGGGAHNMVEAGALLRWHLVGLEPVAPKVYEVAPTSLKMFVTGKGVGDKSMIGAHVAKRWDVVCATNDEADAYGLYRVALCCAGREGTTTDAQHRAITTILMGPNEKAAEKKARKEKRLARMFEAAGQSRPRRDRPFKSQSHVPGEAWDINPSEGAKPTYNPDNSLF